MELARIEIVRELSDDGQDVVSVMAADGSGDQLPLIESLGMLRMAEDTVIRLAMGEAGEDEDDD